MRTNEPTKQDKNPSQGKAVYYDGEWLGFLDGDKEVSGFMACKPQEYADLCEQWETGQLTWNQLVEEVKHICED